jgi:hypothetical protein
VSNNNKKTQKPPTAPGFQNSANFYGDQLASQTYMDPTYGVVTKYNPSPAESQSKSAAQSRINQILPTLGQTSPEMSKQFDDMSNAYADQATAAFNREYAPLQRNVREDYASRFGGGQNTPYIDAINDMETRQRVPALVDIANNATQKRQDLYNTQEQQKLNELQSLGYVLNGDQATFLQNLQNPQQVSSSTNNFNQQNYADQLKQYNADREFQLNQSQNSGLNQGLNALLAAGRMAGKF